MTEATTPPIDPAAILRSRRFVALLVLASVVGVAVSLLAWGFLELIHQIQVGVFTDLPSGLGFDEVPWWWPLPILVLAGIPVAYALRLPGAGGHVPAHGLDGVHHDAEHAPRRRDRRRRLPRARPGARARGAAHRLGRRVHLADGDAAEARRTAADAPGARCGGELRGDLDDLPIAARRRRAGDRGDGPRRADAAAHPPARAAGRRHRVADVHRHLELGRTRHQRLLPRRAAPAVVRQPDLGRGGVVGRPGGRRRGARLRHTAGRPEHGQGRHAAPATSSSRPRAPWSRSWPSCSRSSPTTARTRSCSPVRRRCPGSSPSPAPGRWGRSRWSSSARGSRGRCRSGRSAADRRSPRCTSAPPAACWLSHLPGLSITPAVAVGMAAMAASMLRLPLSSIVIATALTATAGAGSTPLIIVSCRHRLPRHHVARSAAGDRSGCSERCH